ncbi:Centaurin-gamma-1A [Armadillidium nasatum]|uniref:Centaurin-gamma-1A n=1 Tax=Armadillidium nasatum TaxID=96803 RepID=A0A5N5TBT1_9CRUS|nr:Centaurin-gamma-1A [Armadillidium nasatum]
MQQAAFTPNNSRPSTPTHLLRYPSTNNGLNPSSAYSTSSSSGVCVQSVNPLVTGSSPSHVFGNTFSKQEASVRSAFNNGPELTAMTRTDSFRDDAFKRVSAPCTVTSSTFAALPTVSTSTDTSNVRDPLLPPPPPPSSKDLPTPSSTPTTTRKSRRKSNLFTPKKNDDKDKKNEEVGSGRAIPVKQGYLYKKSNKALNKDWKKKYVTLCDNGRLTYHANLHDYMEDVHGKDISLQYTTVKVPGMKPRGSKVVGTENVTSDLNSLNLASSTLLNNISSSGSSLGVKSSLSGINNNIKDKVMLTSYEALHEVHSMNGVESTSKMDTPNVKKRHRRMKSSGLKNAECEDSDGYEFSIVSLDNKQWHFEASSQEERDEWVTAIEQQILFSLQGNESNKSRTNQIMTIDSHSINTIKSQVPGNDRCADCDMPNPEWASINLGILLCIECSGIHRNLGSHISKVRSLDLDDWPPGHISVMKSLGNEFSNSIWEARIHGQIKPTLRSSREEKEKWIRRKYEGKEFLSLPQSDASIHEQMVECVCCGDVRGLSTLIPYGSEFINLPINPSQRDLRTILHLAASLPSLACTQLLIWNNANVKSLDSEGRSCIYYAEIGGDKDVYDLIVQSSGLDTSQTSYGVGMYVSENQNTPAALQSSTLPRRKGSISRKPEILDKLQASVI